MSTDAVAQYSQQLSSALAIGNAAAALEVARTVASDTTLDAETAAELLNHAFTIAAVQPGTLVEHAPSLGQEAAVLVYHPWLGLDYSQMVRTGLARNVLLPVFAGLRTGSGRTLPDLNADTFRTLCHRGINLWSVCQYHAALVFGCMPEQLRIESEASLGSLHDLYVYASELIDEGIDFLRFYQPRTLLLAQGYFPISAVMRQLGLAAGVRIVSIEITLRRDRMLWEDVVGAAVNTHFAKNYFWRYQHHVTPETAHATTAQYLRQIHTFKAAEHASPTDGRQLPPCKRPTLLYLGQVSTDAAVLYGRRGFASQPAAIAAAAAYAAEQGLRLVVKLHPKEGPSFKDPLPYFKGLTARLLEGEPTFVAARQRLGDNLIVDSDNQYNTYQLIEHAEACVTLNSQAGLEALLMGKEVVLAGDAAYGQLGFTHEAEDAPSLEFCLNRVLREGLRRNDGVRCRQYFHIFTELYCLPKTEASLVELALGRPGFSPPANGASGNVANQPTSTSREIALSAAEADAATEDPARFVTPRRLDLVVKFLYFDARLRGGDVAVYEQLYREHILHRTGGQEPVDSTTGATSGKRSVEDYLTHCEVLMRSMQQQGFRSDAAVPIGSNGEIGNGSHRVACALALGLRIATTPSNYTGPSWNFDWFVDHGFAPDMLSRLLHGWCRIHGERTSIFILWAAVENHWDDIEREIARNFQIVGAHEIHFETEAGFASAVYDVYSREEDSVSLPHIDRKLQLLSKFNRRIRVVVAYNGSRAETTSDLSERTKRHIRLLFDHVAPKEDFVTCHASDSPDEARYLADVLLDPNNTKWFDRRPHAQAREQFLHWIVALKRESRRRNFPLHACCVVGSSSLEVLGIRQSTDLDFTLTHQWRHRLFDAGITHVTDHLDVVTEGYHRLEPPLPRISDDELVNDSRHHFWYRGVKFAAPQIIRDRKDFSRRPKDVSDVTLIDAFMEQAEPSVLSVSATQ